MATIPKLALIPSGYKAGKIYSVLPTNGVGDFDFTRNTTATRINSSGLIETVASGKSRLNYPLIDGVVNGCPSHLLEPERTNLISYSEDFSNAAWNKINTTIQSDELISPNGSLNASKLSTNNSNGVHIITDALSGSLQMTYSVFFKKGEYKYGSMSLINGGNSRGSGVVIDLDTFQVVSSQTSSSSFTFKADNYGNGWIRCELTVTNTNSIISLAVIGSWNGIGSVTWNSGFRNPSYIGDSSKGVYIYGAQLEQGSYPTSYIPNYGTAAGITRSAETANGAGDASTFNDSEGVLMAEVFIEEDIESNVNISISNGVHEQNLIKFIYLPSENAFKVQSYGSNNTILTTIQFFDFNLGQYNKVLLVYNSTTLKMYVNGFEVGSASVNGVPSGLNQLNFDRADGSAPFYGNTKQIQYFDSALNDSDLEKITSWTSFTDLANGQTYSIK